MRLFGWTLVVVALVIRFGGGDLSRPLTGSDVVWILVTVGAVAVFTNIAREIIEAARRRD